MAAKKTTQQFIEEATLKHNGFYDYSKVIYVNNETKVIIICPIHREFEQTPHNHLHGYGCKSCRDDKHRKTTEQFIEEATLRHNGFYDYSKSKYERNHKSITITCPVHGDFEQKSITHLRGHGCKSCDVDNRRKTTEQFIEDANKVHNNLYDYSKVDYKNKRTKVTIICFKHGEFKQEPNHHVLKGNGCPNCISSISKPSQKWLDYRGIPNIMRETREVKLKLGGKTITVDGYDPQTNTVYEFHGDYWHGNPAMYHLNERNRTNNKTFGELLAKTQKRSRLLMSHGYNVVSIWESDWIKLQKELEPQAAK